MEEQTPTNTNPTCAQCQDAHNGVSGRYCKLLKRYVEYAPEPICEKHKTTNH